MLQQDEPDDYVLATDEEDSVGEFIKLSFEHIGRVIEWRGHGLAEKGYDTKLGKRLVEIDPRYFRPTEVDLLIVDEP